jgi:hypothetical protein
LDTLLVSGSYAGVIPNKIITVTIKAQKHWWILGGLPGITNPTTVTAGMDKNVEH